MAEFIVLKACIKAIIFLRYKLRIFGVQIQDDEPTYVFTDNESVTKNCTNVELTLNKKHASLAYHFACWHVAAGVVTLAWIDGKENLADPFTKRLAEATQGYLFGNWTY